MVISSVRVVVPLPWLSNTVVRVAAVGLSMRFPVSPIIIVAMVLMMRFPVGLSIGLYRALDRAPGMVWDASLRRPWL